MEKLLRKLVKTSAKIYYKFIYDNKPEYAYIPPSGKLLSESELMNMIDSSLDMWLTSGRFNDEFEDKFAKYLGVKHALTVNSGSSANMLAISALTSHKLGDRRLKKGDEIITVAAGFPTTVAPIVQNGMIPVFIDCELKTYNIDVDKIEETISEKTKAIFIAHTLGNPFDVIKVAKICEKHNLWLIEDSCDALGAKVDGKYTGSVGHIGTYSFYPAHHITMGEGGAVVTNNSKLHKILMSLRDWGRDCWCKPGEDNSCKKRFLQKHGNLPFGYDHKYTYSHFGYNFKITDWQASIALAQLNNFPLLLRKRRENAEFLMNSLRDLEEYLILPQNFKNIVPSWFGFLISVRENAKFTKQELVEYLEKNGIGTRQLFAGNILRQPMFVEDDISLKIASSELLYSNELNECHYKMLPNTEYIMNSTFWIGTFPALSSRELTRISDAIHTFINGIYK